MKIAVIYFNFLNGDGSDITIGGIQTYIFELCNLILASGNEPIVIQQARISFCKTYKNIKVVGVPPRGLHQRATKNQLYATAVGQNPNIIVFGSDNCSVRADFSPCVSIQHGIYWDLPSRLIPGNKLSRTFLSWLWKVVVKVKAKRYFENIPNRVCVDYNFMNWYRTVASQSSASRVWTVPNFSRTASKHDVDARQMRVEPIRVLFARRFAEYRGTRIMAAAAKAILSRHSNVSFTFAGEGPDEAWLREYFEGINGVAFLRYAASEALEINAEHDISVVPSLGSEGTSLSVAEALASGSVVVATAVGGVTNMIIDGYNGLLVSPDVGELTCALETLITDSSLRQQLSARAYETAIASFNIDVWKLKWQQIFQDLSR